MHVEFWQRNLFENGHGEDREDEGMGNMIKLNEIDYVDGRLDGNESGWCRMVDFGISGFEL
jgi:hypothetical protein